MRSICPYAIAAWLALGGMMHAAEDVGAEAGIPALVFPEGVGVNIHFVRGRERDLDMIAAAGFKFVRMDFSWSGTERSLGRYTWDEYDELTANLDKRKLRALYILDYSNALYEDKLISRDPISGKEVTGIAAPRKPASVAAFARWAAAAAEHYRGRGILWEIWNEPNIGFWKPQPNVADYTALALATCRAMREADPQTLILAPASSGFPWAFFESLFQAGTLEHLDAVSVHPYRNYSQGPETAAADYRRLRAMIERDAPADKKALPIISGEWGYATHTKGVSPATQAAFFARQQLANLYHGVPLSIWYDWKNDGTDPEYNEHNFGTVTHELQPKPAYQAVWTLTNQLSGYRIARRLAAGDSAVWVLLCVDAAGNQKLAAWTTGEPAPIRLALGLTADDAVSAVDGLGQPLAVRMEGGQLAVELDSLPQYLTFGRPVRSLTAAAAWRVEPLSTLVAAGRAEPIRASVRATNPFGRPCRVRLTLDSPAQSALVPLRAPPGPGDDPAGGAAVASLNISPGEEAVHHFEFSLVRRDDEFPAVTVRTSYHEVQGTDTILVGSSEERVAFVLGNPLRLTVAPVDSGLRIAVADPAHSGFEGTAVVDGVTVALKTDGGSAELTTRNSATTGDRSVAVELRDEQGRVVLPKTAIRFRPLDIPRYRAALDGDAQIPATAELTETSAPAEPAGAAAPFPRVQRLDYRFDSGWRFVRCVAETGRPSIEGRPDALGLWIHGDGSGNSLRIRVVDDSGQTFQPTGPNLDWTGWRWVEFDLTKLEHVGRWGGADDGRVHGGLRLDTVLLVDSTRNNTAGTIYFAAPMLRNADSAGGRP